MRFDTDALAINLDIDSDASESGTYLPAYTANAVAIWAVSASAIKSVSAKSKRSQ